MLYVYIINIYGADRDGAFIGIIMLLLVLWHVVFFFLLFNFTCGSSFGDGVLRGVFLGFVL